MWAAPLPYYSEYFDSKRKPSPQVVALKTDLRKDAAQLSPAGSPTGAEQSSANDNMNSFLEPALDMPPSPERLRQLSKQMKRASHANQAHLHRTPSPRSSSLRSATGDRPSWEQALENMSLTRRPSNRSTGSSVPSRDRPESVQGFGKNLFQRLGKSNRESTAQSSSGSSSVYSADSNGESSTPAAPKESIMPSLFSSRKQSRDASIQRRLRISGPFNFQHVTHTQREHLPNPRRGNRMELVDELSAMRPPHPTSASALANGNQGGDPLPPSLSSSSVSGRLDNLVSSTSRPTTAPSQPSSPRQLRSHPRSHERLRPSPPPRSARRPSMQTANPSSVPAVPPVPPRCSSRQGAFSTWDAEGADASRSPASGNFRPPQPYSPSDSTSTAMPSPELARYHGQTQVNCNDPFVASDRPVSRALTTPDDSAWPLGPNASPVPIVCPVVYDSPLPDVPEEEEHHGFARRSRLSLTSNSSLRGSQSVPGLRSLAQSQRPLSGASETLGQMEQLLAHRLNRARQQGDWIDAESVGSNWEDAIDYCYEHEAEANCEYEWERPSLDLDRSDATPAVQLQLALMEDDLAEARSAFTSRSSPGFLLASGLDVPALSPASPTSTATCQELPTPVSNQVPNNFSLPRVDLKGTRSSTKKKLRPISTALSFREVNEFTLSPSLLIPNDYHHQVLQSAADKHQYVEEEDLVHSTYEHADLDLSSAHLHQRSSTSTTETNSTRRSDSIGDRHVSTHSTWTTLTRLTTSSTSLNKMAGSWSDGVDPVPESKELDSDSHDAQQGDEERTPLASEDSVPELAMHPTPLSLRRSQHKTHASESLARDELAPLQTQDSLKMRRPRARTTSATGHTPPVGQYALFPKEYTKPTGERI
ncbi:hypothetical protein S7711_04572 [Stachybotrys chartarum IBT 7711]|uniref:CRIB domain-containing protein n=1 Tax=Stachybotrys chartarum (strain CBS 109288 / IBT 7711) TaxID=1280523 RepID=A0A084APU2_STACB|nr:hypothetical protein S7711_04572 [Stachybotrys chartarum IBT 7711]KFA52838.1 hypothetical protein S40293_00929 [Stachybotrys chartarum IBT 40293]